MPQAWYSFSVQIFPYTSFLFFSFFLFFFFYFFIYFFFYFLFFFFFFSFIYLFIYLFIFLIFYFLLLYGLQNSFYLQESSILAANLKARSCLKILVEVVSRQNSDSFRDLCLKWYLLSVFWKQAEENRAGKEVSIQVP